MIPSVGSPKGVVGGQPPLLHRRRGQGGEANDVADGVDVVYLGLETVVYEDPPAALHLESGVVQVEVVGLSLTSRRVHYGLGWNLFAAGQGGHGARRADIDRGHFLAEPECHRQVAQVEFQRLDDLGVAEVQHVVPLLHDGDFGAQRSEHGGVFDADHAGTDHDHRGWQRFEIEDPVGVEHPFFVKFDSGWPCRPGASGDDDVVAGDGGLFPAGLVLHEDGVRVDEPAMAHDQIDAVTHQLVAHHVDFLADHVLGPRQQVGRGDPVLHAVACAVQLALVHAGEVEHSLTQRFGWDRACVDADAAEHSAAFDDGHGLAQLRRGDGGFLSARA